MKLLTKYSLSLLFIAVTIAGLAQEKTEVLYFGHAGWTGKINHDEGIDNQNAFNTGGFDLFITSDLNDRLSVLGELFMGFKGDGGTLVDFNIERLYFKYQVSDVLNLKIGRQYTPMGFWNNTYTQGIVFQPTINRPYSVRNENDKGVLTTNSVGLQIDGEDIGAKQFSYYFMVDNTAGAPSINTDNTTSKAYTGKLKFEPLLDWDVFVSVRFDKVVAGSESIQGITQPNDVDQTIYNVGFAHMTITSPLEVAFEYFRVINDVNTIGKSQNNLGYGYLGYRINKWTPYAQHDFLDYDEDDTYFAPATTTGLVLGARYNFTPSSVIKMEYKYRDIEGRTDRQDVFSVQVAAVF